MMLHSVSVSSKRRRVIKAPKSAAALNHFFARSGILFMGLQLKRYAGRKLLRGEDSSFRFVGIEVL
jgi:hypothetical protein